MRYCGYQIGLVHGVLVMLLLTGFAITLNAPVHARTDAQTDPFPEYPTLTDHVEFWKKVWGEWSRGQVAVHDLDHPAIVYEVIDLAGPHEDRYTDEQEDFVEDVKEAWEDRLEALSRKVAAGKALSYEEKQLALRISEAAGTDALRKAADRVRTQRGLRERFRRGVEISYRYDAVFREIFRDAGVPEDLVYLPHVESSFQARARSSAGASGIWQFTRGTGRQYLTITTSIDERFDPVAAAEGAAKYLSDAFRRLGDWPIALTSYNHGVAGMQRAVKQFGRDYEAIFSNYRSRSFGFASKNFYAEFLAARAIAREPERYFPEGLSPEPPLEVDAVVLSRRTTVPRIVSAYHVDHDELVELNPAWTDRAIKGHIGLPSGTVVWMPKATLARLEDRGIVPDTEALSSETEAFYVVRRGDNLTSIAERHGMRLGELRELNGIPNRSSLIHVGQKLRVTTDSALEVHVVQEGDTLSDIARDRGMTLNHLRRLNGIPERSSLIHIGQPLQVIGHTPRAVHIVKSGETLSQIAVRYEVGLSSVLDLNRLSRRSLIHPGQAIRIPN